MLNYEDIEDFENQRILCEYGCGKIATFTFQNGKECCSDNFAKCPGIRKRMSESHKGKTPWNKGMKFPYKRRKY